ncbi:aspartate aminotransferase family protein [Mesorhizobium sp. M0938]|uniref:aspartate aminotransferase family protein n=1 Tax=unclassified Mesorhizobium TaxID=325217 RepID=UPI0033383AA6
MNVRDGNLALAARASKVMAGGHLSPSRKLGASIAFTRASGCYLFDADGNRYTDFHCGFGANVLGHCHPAIAARVHAVSHDIDLIGAGITQLEVETCEVIARNIPCAELVSLCSSGSEATFHALRIARAFTGRKKVIKFQGGYHGWHDAVAMNVQSESGAIGRYDPLCDGIMEETARHTIVLPYNDAGAVEAYLKANPGEVAAIIVEPIAHNIGSVIGTDAFLSDLRTITREQEVVLIFDEVITGFRHALGGYQSICGVTPDLATFGKAAGSGYPVGIVAGRRDIMECVGRTGKGSVFMGGTFNGTPSSLAAVLATIEELSKQGTYERLSALGMHMRKGLDAIALRHGLEAQSAGFGSVWLLYFFSGAYSRYDDLLRNDDALDLAFRQKMIEHRLIGQPLPLKRLYLSLAHTPEILDESLGVIDSILERLIARR